MKHNFKRIGLALILSLLLYVFAPLATVHAEEITKIVIIHTNDTHARVFEDEYEGMGFAKISAIVKQMRQENPNTLLVDAGDTLHGLNIAILSRGESIVEFMNAMGYDAMVPGNHDFNYGYQRLIELSEMMDFPLISANIAKDGEPLFEPYIVKEIDGIKIAFIGLSTPETRYKTHPGNVKDLLFFDPITAASDMVLQLQSKADFIVVLSHLGIDKDSEVTSEMVANNVEGIDIIIDGHSHSVLPEGKVVGDTLIVQTGEHTKNLGIIEIEFLNKKAVSIKAGLISKEEARNIQPDEEIAKLISKVEEDYAKITSVKIAEAAVRLDGEREHVRTRETNLGNLVTDAIISGTGADIAIVNGGVIRASIEPGDITVGDVIMALPFADYVVVKEVSGKDVIAALEHGTSSYPEPKGAFPQVGDMTFQIDITKPLGQRVTDVRIAGEPIDPEKMYRLALTDFLASGGDEYYMFPQYETLLELSNISELVIDYIKELGYIDVSEEGRIAVIGVPQETRGEETSLQGEPMEIAESANFEKPAAAVQERSYVVKPGDVLWRIAEMFGTTWEKLADYNGLENPHLIFPGQTICIPAI